MTLSVILMTAGLGALGAVVRWLVLNITPNRMGRLWIFIANVAGSAIVGAFAALPESPFSFAVMAGFCGSLTTFSTLAVQLVPTPNAPSRGRLLGLGIAHIGASVLACWLAFELATTFL